MMNADYQQLTEMALALSIEQRIELVRRLEESLECDEVGDPAHQEQVMAVVRQRMEELKRGTAREVEWSEILDEARKSIRCE